KEYVALPLAAFAGGAAVAFLGGLIGLGSGEFRLPLLIAVFALYPHRAVRINLLISLATLATAGRHAPWVHSRDPCRRVHLGDRGDAGRRQCRGLGRRRPAVA